MKYVRKYYAGLDIHKDVVEYCILDAAGGKIDGGRIICERSVLERMFRISRIRQVLQNRINSPFRLRWRVWLSFENYTNGVQTCCTEAVCGIGHKKAGRSTDNPRLMFSSFVYPIQNKVFPECHPTPCSVLRFEYYTLTRLKSGFGNVTPGINDVYDGYTVQATGSDVPVMMSGVMADRDIGDVGLGLKWRFGYYDFALDYGLLFSNQTQNVSGVMRYRF